MHAYFNEELAAQLVDVSSFEDLDRTLADTARRLGFDHFALSLDLRCADRAAPSILLHDYPDEWAKVYTGFGLAGQDPVRRACDRSFVGFAWKQIERIIPLTRGDRQMLAVGRECGIGDGYTIPRHLPGLAQGTCTFVVKPGNHLPQTMLTTAEIAGSLAMAAALNLCGSLTIGTVPALSDRQRECVLWMARGKTAAETAIILNISLETVNQHLKMSRERYGVHCKQSLLIWAMFDGLIGFKDVIGRYH
jgi:LuxR family transcriptional regulator, quorum-sensing system regulator CciR